MSAPPRPGDRLQARSGREYRVQAWHAEGSYARVFRGEAVSPPRACALKVAKPEVPSAGNRLSREIEVRSRFRHVAVPESLDTGCAGETPFLATVWVEGPTLRAHVERLRRLPLVVAAGLLREVGGVIARLHGDGLAHGDLRADNVILVTQKDGLHAVVTDLGAASQRGESGFEAAPAADVLRLGGLLHFMLIGVTPEPGDGRLSRANGHHPQAIRLWEAARAETMTAPTFLRDLEALHRALVRR